MDITRKLRLAIPALLLVFGFTFGSLTRAQEPIEGPDGKPREMPGLQLAWIDRGGKTEIVGRPGPYLGLEVAPDGKRIAVHRHEEAGGDIWVLEADGKETRITVNSSRDNASPVWSPDGKRIAYAGKHKGRWSLYQSAANGSGMEETLFESPAVKAPLGFTPDGKQLIFFMLNAETNGDIWILPLEHGTQPSPLLQTRANEWNAQVSPDGKWLAFTSNIAAGRDEVYVQPFPSGGEQFRVSRSGGAWPRWRRDGKELYYRADPETFDGSAIAVRSTVMAVPVSVKNRVFSTGMPAALQPVLALGLHHTDGGTYHSYDVTSDGKRILNFLSPNPLPRHQLATDFGHGGR